MVPTQATTTPSFPLTLRKYMETVLADQTASRCSIPRKYQPVYSLATIRTIRGAFCELHPGMLSTLRYINIKNVLHCSKDVVLTDQSLMHVFFTDLVSTRYRMDIYQTWLGTLATFGGILGLFLGFSLITGFEFIYLFTVRVLFDKYTLYKKRK